MPNQALVLWASGPSLRCSQFGCSFLLPCTLQIPCYYGRFPYQAWRATFEWLFACRQVDRAQLGAQVRTALFAAAEWKRCTKEHIKLLKWIVEKFEVAGVSINHQVRPVAISAVVLAWHGLMPPASSFAAPSSSAANWFSPPTCALLWCRTWMATQSCTRLPWPAQTMSA